MSLYMLNIYAVTTQLITGSQESRNCTQYSYCTLMIEWHCMVVKTKENAVQGSRQAQLTFTCNWSKENKWWYPSLCLIPCILSQTYRYTTQGVLNNVCCPKKGVNDLVVGLVSLKSNIQCMLQKSKVGTQLQRIQPDRTIQLRCDL